MKAIDEVMHELSDRRLLNDVDDDIVPEIRAAITAHIEAETARLRALLDERTALLRECLYSSCDIDEHNPDLADRVREAIKETTCDS